MWHSCSASTHVWVGLTCLYKRRKKQSITPLHSFQLKFLETKDSESNVQVRKVHVQLCDRQRRMCRTRASNTDTCGIKTNELKKINPVSTITFWMALLLYYGLCFTRENTCTHNHTSAHTYLHTVHAMGVDDGPLLFNPSEGKPNLTMGHSGG